MMTEDRERHLEQDRRLRAGDCPNGHGPPRLNGAQWQCNSCLCSVNVGHPALPVTARIRREAAPRFPERPPIPPCSDLRFSTGDREGGTNFLRTGLANRGVNDMAGRGPAPKPAHLRQRRGRKSTAAELVAPETPNVPELPSGSRKWHELTLNWWRDVWASPMASEFLDTDAAGLARLAILVDDFNAAEMSSERVRLLTEIRLQEARFGLSPVDRARLHWEVAKGEEAERRRRPEKPARPDRVADPRLALKVVS